MTSYKNTFKKLLAENGPGYIPTAPNTSGSGGVFGNAASIGAAGSASGTPGGDTYAPGDARIPTFMGITKRSKKAKVKKKK